MRNGKDFRECKEPESAVERFSYRLKIVIKHDYKTQKNFAKAVGMSEATIVGYLKGTAFPYLPALIKIAQVADVSLDWLCGLTED